MKLYSTNNPSTLVTLKEAVMQGLPPDNGLFMPESIPTMPPSFFQRIQELSFTDIAWEVARTLLNEDLDDDSLRMMIAEVFNFEVPVRPVTERAYCLELFHGPTLAFKDYGARFMARLMAYFLHENDSKPCILVATSGDTGSAVAHGFYQVPGIDVVILYPSGKVSEIQEMQLTTLGGNITALEIDGTFDDCQRLVKTAFLDQELRQTRDLTSANSINIARLIPQSFYYFQVYAKLRHLDKPIVCSVPSGNFGNLTAGLLAKKMGLPIHRFIASNNDNKVFFDYLLSGNFIPRPSISTISNAMDVGNPSNFDRIMDLYQKDRERLTQQVNGFTFSDAQTSAAISQVHQETGYIMDPHGAVGYLGLQEYFKMDPDAVGVFLGTAHPAKFLDVVKPLVSDRIEIPARLKKALESEKRSIRLSSNYNELKDYLRSK